jgi:Fur family transcriptional regulator, peroxide stress response regulator
LRSAQTLQHFNPEQARGLNFIPNPTSYDWTKFNIISTATVYKVLDALVENHIIRRVKTDSDVMRYDGIMDKHHHLYCAQTDRIEDYADEDLDLILANHFRKKGIDGFKIEDIRLQIVGKFTG